MAPTYRYYTTDLLTGNVLGELPLYGTFMSRQLSNAGNFNGTFRLGTHIEDDEEMISASYPQRTCLYCERDNELIWGGILWSRTYSSQAHTVQITAQTFESYFSKCLMLENFARPDVETQDEFNAHEGVNQLQIFVDLIDAMQAQPNSNIGLNTERIDTSGGFKKKLAIPWYDFKYYSDAIDELTSADDGFDFTVDVVPSSTIDQPDKFLVVGQPKIVPGGTAGTIVYDYPGSITDFYWPESGSKGATDFAFLGNGSGSNMLVAFSRWIGASGYPAVWQVQQEKNVSSREALQAMATAQAAASNSATSVPTITLKPDREPAFEGWSALGSIFRARLESPRFPNGKDINSRMIGWELSPGSSEQSESLKLLIEGEEDATV